MKKKTCYLFIILGIIFIIYNLVWYFGWYNPHNILQNNFPEIEKSGVKIYTDEEGFQYSVATPDYLMWNGNLSISEPNNEYTLIIWKKPFKDEFDKGIILNGYKDLNTQIMLKRSDTAEEKEDQSIVENNINIFHTLFEKANKVWKLRLE